MKAADIFKRAIGEIFYPEGVTCAVCGNDLDASSRYGICPGCSVPFISLCCEKCGAALSERGRRYCDRCVGGNDGHSFDVARAPFPYARDSVRKLVHKLKYGKQPYRAKIMAVSMADFLSGLGWNDTDLITFVPLHPKKLRQRTYNQSELLARNIAEISSLPIAATLEKTTYTKKSAASLGREDRLQLLRNTFAVGNDADIKGKNILLVDDVYTTGATADECAKALKAKKARTVRVLTYATSIGDKSVTYAYDEEEGIRRLRETEGAD